MNNSKSDETKLVVYVCLGSSCHLKGAYKVVEKLKESLIDQRIELRGSLCMGNCSEGVNVRFGNECFGNISISNVESLIEKIKERLSAINGSEESR
ncbi:NAD(P)H-dependent oxidoreductase subunit E [Fervidobacterium sp.]